MSLTIEFAVDDPGECPVASTAEAAGATTSAVARASVADDGPVTEEFTLPTDAPPDDPGDVARVASTDAGQIYRFERDGTDPCVCETIERVAGPATDVRAEAGTLVVTARADDLETVRTVVERLRDAFGSVRVRRLTELEAGSGADARIVDRGRLTDRQREVLETAYEMGYYDYPKAANAGDVADELGISRSTFAEHLAAAQGKLLGAILGPEASVTP